jgi:membrane protein DedA with SNARE-associated domain/rhodanese-related sulfurtransferase
MVRATIGTIRTLQRGDRQLIHIPASSITTWGSVAVFANVLLTRLGAPLPAVPILVLAGSAIANGTLIFSHVLLAAVLAALLGDGAWFTAGRLYGRRLINVLARVSLSVDSSVRTARAYFERFGVPIAAVSKFVPGLALITPPMMGTTRIAPLVFFVWDTAGSVAWASFWLLGGALFEHQLAALLREVRPHGMTIVDVLVTAIVLYSTYRYLRRWRFRKWLAHAYVSPGELDAMMRSHSPPVIFDARRPSLREEEPYRIAGALLLDPDAVDDIDDALSSRNVVVYCMCPNDATAKHVCQQLHDKGFMHVHPLRGGLDAWRKAGLAVEPLPPRLENVMPGFARL